MSRKAMYCYPQASCNLAPLAANPNGLTCSNGHFFPFVSHTDIPVFIPKSDHKNEYTRQDAAVVHDNSLRWVCATFKSDEETLRQNLLARLQLKPGYKVLITGAGNGNDLPYFIQKLDGQGEIYAQDIAPEMLLAGVERHSMKSSESGVSLFFSISDATNLPFKDNFFDAAYHFGGINLFPDIQKGISEMNRTVKPGGKVLIGDEGVAPWLKNTLYGKMLIHNNPLYAFDIPLAFLPESAQAVHVTWEWSNCFYVIDFIVGEKLPELDIDVPHVGTRGGSIRTRYFGQLEGIDPTLRDRIYAESERLGMSRVDYIESVFRSAISID